MRALPQDPGIPKEKRHRVYGSKQPEALWWLDPSRPKPRNHTWRSGLGGLVSDSAATGDSATFCGASRLLSVSIQMRQKTVSSRAQRRLPLPSNSARIACPSSFLATRPATSLGARGSDLPQTLGLAARCGAKSARPLPLAHSQD